jgi:hypothetical protein
VTIFPGPNAAPTPPAGRPPSSQGPRPGVHPAWSLGIGFIGYWFGSLPWLLTGLRLPLQNLWAVEVTPDRMPLALLPFSQYALSLIAGLIIFGAAASGLVIRRAFPAGRGRAVLLGCAGWLLGFAVALLQSTRTLEHGLADEPRSLLYLFALIGTAIVAAVTGLIGFGLLGAAPPAGAAIGATLGALAAGIWVNAVIVPFGSVPSPFQVAVLSWSHWLPAVLVGVALAWCGFGRASQITSWIVCLLLLWAIPAGLTAAGYGAGSRVLAQHPRDMLDAASDVFVMALGPAGVSLRYVLVAVVIGILGLLVRRARRAAGRVSPGLDGRSTTRRRDSLPG